MSKYIIEIAEEYEEYFKGVLICGIIDGKFAVDVIAREDLEELNSDYINEHYGELQDEAYKQGYAEAERIWRAPSSDNEFYQKGFEDGKNSTDMGCEGCRYSLRFAKDEPCKSCSNCYKSKYEPMPQQDDRIEVGDEVIYNGTTKCIVVRPEDDERYASLIDGDGTHYSADHRECKKTGKHYDIQSILEAMRE